MADEATRHHAANQTGANDASLPDATPAPIANPVADAPISNTAVSKAAVSKAAVSKAMVARPVVVGRTEYVSVLALRQQSAERGGLHGAIRQLPSFLFSMLVHVLVLIALGLWWLPDLPALVTADLLALPSDLDDEEPLAELDEVEPQLELNADDVELEVTDHQPDTDLVSENVSFSPANELDAAPPAEVRLMDFASDAAPLTFQTQAAGFDGQGLSGRGQASRAALVRRGGGNDASESALALRWIAEHQNANGSWSFDHRHARACQGRCANHGSLDNAPAGATAMALLPMLGAGHTHVAGGYQQVVNRGLATLVKQMDIGRNGGSLIDGGNMYSHGLASIVLCEAYAMTDDPSLVQPAQLALNFISYAQGPRGGWRYRPQTPGDTSVVGWQIMALKSGHMAMLQVPVATVQRAGAFLDFAQVDDGTGYSYAANNFEYRYSTSAIGLLCRMYLGWKKENAALVRGVSRIAAEGPSSNNYYYNYYATQLLFQFTDAEGPVWEKWNTAMRDQLVETQATTGHERGSWFVDQGHHTDTGGRLYNTALACMTLEVYYRHMPIYQGDAVEMEFPE
jgi:hypothetical protein